MVFEPVAPLKAVVVEAQTEVVPAVWELEAPVVRSYPFGALADAAW